MNKKLLWAIAALAALILLLIIAIVLTPSRPAGLSEDVVLTTDKTVYSADETIAVTVKNNLDRPIWFYTTNCGPGLGLFGERNEFWELVPMLPMEPPILCRPKINKLEPGESTTLEYQPSLWHDKAFLNFSSYKLGIGYTLAEGMMESLPAYSNEFTIAESVVTGDLVLYTDKSDYYPSEIIEATVHNNSASPLWYKIIDFQSCNLGAVMTKGPLELERYRLYSGLRGGEWIPVPTSSDDDFGMTCGYEMQELKSGESETLQHFLSIFYESGQFGLSEHDQLLTSRYRLAIEYAKINDVTKVEKGYSNEFTVLHETECERIERETPGLLEEVKKCERDSECVADKDIAWTTLAACYIIRSNQYDTSFELSQLKQNLLTYSTTCETVEFECALPPESLSCEDNKCVESTAIVYPPNTDSVEDRLAVESVYQTYIDAGQVCDIELSNSTLTERTLEIIHPTCSNLYNESKCYVGREYEIITKPETALVYLTPFSYTIENPFFFSKEDGEWKLDLYRMAFGMAMGGSTCDSGWGWTDLELRDEFCSYFPENECPDDQNTFH